MVFEASTILRYAVLLYGCIQVEVLGVTHHDEDHAVE